MKIFNLSKSTRSSAIRPEAVIREDLRQQLAVIYQRYLAKWVYPCRP